MTFMQWIINEYRLAKADTWAGGVYHNTAAHPECKATLEKLATVRDRMKRQRMRLLDGAPYNRNTDLKSSFAIIRGERHD